MDLSALGSSLPPGLADAERDMGDKFRAYHVGYSACLADVLSTVQSSIGAGQDASQTLSRLMDWAEAREVAMAAFAADESDEPPSANPAPPAKRAPLLRQTLQNLHARPASAPPDTSPAREHKMEEEVSPAGPSRPGPDFRINSFASTPVSTESAPGYQPTPASVSSAASSPTAAITGSRQYAPAPIRISRSPLRYRTDQPSSSFPTSTFNPSLPANVTMPLRGETQSVAQSIPVGAKRTVVDAEMSEETSATSANPAPVTPSGRREAREARAAKRRNVGVAVIKQEEGDDRDKRRNGRRGHGPASAGL
ncbi:hypothetical protein EHS25_005433 [Saitozyma podzolica]|uniref:Uncharacterized protein n=1 Tax=Saitozyma podzolica TaxID=1890683 RepID=A0A427XY59_9TREE|nr:hypothetical protein EHS25_005433 [Saitozyma podzolica]